MVIAVWPIVASFTVMSLVTVVITQNTSLYIETPTIRIVLFVMVIAVRPVTTTVTVIPLVTVVVTQNTSLYIETPTIKIVFFMMMIAVGPVMTTVTVMPLLTVVVTQSSSVELLQYYLSLHGELQLLVVQPVQLEVKLVLSLGPHHGKQWNVCKSHVFVKHKCFWWQGNPYKAKDLNILHFDPTPHPMGQCCVIWCYLGNKLEVKIL